jgi:hypothetical protein
VEIAGPERLADQGLGPHQEESGNRAILALLTDPEVAEQTDLVITWRAGGEPGPGAYEVWSRRGLLRFQRVRGEDGRFVYPVLEVVGENPIACDDPRALRSVAEEREAARTSGFDPDDPARRFIAPEQQSYPFARERIAALFDSPNAPDLVISPRDWCQGAQPGTHGALHVRQSRAPLWFAGPGVRAGVHELAARAVDIAPTALAALGFPCIDGADATGRTASRRGVAPDVLLRRQDGRVLDEILSSGGARPRRVYVFLLDGLHHTELEDRLASGAPLPGLRRLRERAAVLASGSIVNFPSITWPSHTTIGTGTWCGHHDVVNPSYYLREKRELVSPQGQQVRTEGFSSRDVESLHEAFHRVLGPAALTAAIHAPFGRGADHAVLEGRNLGHRERLRALTAELASDCDPRWAADGHEAVARESQLDNRGMAQVIELFTRTDREPPVFVFHELALTDGAGHDYGPHHPGLHAALAEGDRRVARVLDLLERRGLLDETLFVLTADHGMAPQDVSLRANPARHVERIGMAAVVAEPMIWLRDLAIEVERAADGRTARVIVLDGDALPSGERPPVEGAEVMVQVQGELLGHGHSAAHALGHTAAHALARGHTAAHALARGHTGPGGVFGFATPSDVASGEIVLAVHAEGFNRRHLRLDGRSLGRDPRAELYGAC